MFLFSFGTPISFSIIAKFLSLSVPLNHLFVLTPGNPFKYSISIPESSAIHAFPFSCSATVLAFFSAFCLNVSPSSSTSNLILNSLIGIILYYVNIS